MAQIDLKQLIGKFNETCRRSLESATGLCMSRSHYNIEIEHWLFKILEIPGSDLEIIVRQYDIDPSRFITDISHSLDGFKTGNSRPPALSPDLVKLAKEGWLVGSVDMSDYALRTGHLIAALLSDENLSRIANGMSDEFKKISIENLKAGFHSILADSVETGQAGAGPLPGGKSRAPGVPGQPPAGGDTPSLDQYTIDLTDRAKAGNIDPVLGRDHEIRQITDILTRRRQNNPILTGEAGVGKTAVVEGFALKIASGDVPPSLKNVSLRSLDLGLLQAGAGIKGEFENRLKSVINEVKASPIPIILFIDEAHTMIGAGGQAGQSDAANLLKPALARGELRTIAATTWSEYKKYFEKDPALARRFQVIKVEEPNEKSAIEMMRGISEVLEKHHKVRVMNEAIIDSVRLSSRYISGRQLPDKSVSLLDTTCARIGLSQCSVPAPVEDCQRRIDQLKVTIGILDRESAIGEDHAEELEELRRQLEATTKEFEALHSRWAEELELVKRINEISDKLVGKLDLQEKADSEEPEVKSEGKSKERPNGNAEMENQPGEPPRQQEKEDEAEISPAELAAQLSSLKGQLAELQGEEPLVHVEVNCQAIAETVSSWTGIPLGRMVSDEIQVVLKLKERMEESIVGQSHALEQIAQSIRTSRANLNDPRTPIGVFLLAGTSGTGKTETAITLAELLYGGEQNMTVINMSEFKEEHKVSMLMGTSAGYVGYGEGGVLTEAVRRKPYSVVLLDEMEKAHPGVQDIFYQVFDKGAMKDGEGRDIDFRNTVIMMTSNAGTDLIKNLCSDPEMTPEPDAFMAAVFPELLKTFKPAFLGRVTVIPFYPLNDEVMKKIIRLKLGKVGRRIQENYRASFDYSPELVQVIADRCTEVDTGARNVDHILNKTLLPELSAEFLSRLSKNLPVSAVNMSVSKEGNFVYDLS